MRSVYASQATAPAPLRGYGISFLAIRNPGAEGPRLYSCTASRLASESVCRYVIVETSREVLDRDVVLTKMHEQHRYDEA